MKNFRKIITDYFVELQEKMIAKKLTKKLGTSFKTSTGKTIMSGDDTMSLNMETNKLRQKVLDDVTEVMVACKNAPDKMIEYIRNNATPVYIISDKSKLLKNIGEEDGFILPQNGMHALTLNMNLNKRVSFVTPAMFVFREEMLDEYYILQQFYKWMSYRAGLPGFDVKIQKILKRYLAKGYNIAKLNAEETFLLKEAVSRDTEATDFAIEVARIKDGGRNVLNKMQDGGANI